MMDLLCFESLTEEKGRQAPLDPSIYNDPRVLINLLKEEDVYTVSKPYFDTFQPEVTGYVRKVMIIWMLELCEELGCEEAVIPLSINYFDRFLATCKINSGMLQLTAITSILIASKVRMSTPVSVRSLMLYVEKHITSQQILDWELLMLSKLSWNVCGITGFDFVDHLLQYLSFTNPSKLIRSHALTLLGLAYADPELICIKASVLSCGALISAARGLKLQPDISHTVCTLTTNNPDLVEAVVAHIEGVLAEVSRKRA